MVKPTKKLPAFFYENARGVQPVREWILGLTWDDRKLIGRGLQMVEFGWPLGMPYCRSLGAGLWEVRVNLTDGKIGRVIFCVSGQRMVLLHGFVKKTQETPQQDLLLARKRMKEVC
ncbi:MAG: type II toxin-antitoxin system RelE/ParE family toxin [Bryobacterales bacterium]|nr:type II toxin-antitoxin system RelE/ParE family toxin [Bryobacterales bacterium]